MPNDHFPWPHFPFLDQAVHHVRVFARKVFDLALLVGAKNEQGAINGFRESARENQLSPLAHLSGDTQMLLAVFRPARDIIVHHFINQGVVVHWVTPTSQTRKAATGRPCR